MGFNSGFKGLISLFINVYFTARTAYWHHGAVKCRWR